MATKPVDVDLTAKVVNISVKRGDAWSIKVTLTGHDLTGATIEAQLRDRANSETAIDLDISPANLAAGEFYVGQTEATVKGVYDVQITPAEGLPRTYIGGHLNVSADVTHA